MMIAERMMVLKKRLLFRLRPDRRSLWKDAAKTLLILLVVTAVNFVMDRSVGDAQNVSELYLLSVLLISLSTSGYFWGLLGAAAGVICTNYLFTYPYYTFNFSLQGYPGRRGLAFAHGRKCSVDHTHRSTGIRTSESTGSGGGSRGPSGQPVPEAAVRNSMSPAA